MSNWTHLTTKARKILQQIEELCKTDSDMPEFEPDSQNPYNPGQPSHSELGWSSGRLDSNHFDSGQRLLLESLPQQELNLPALGGYYHDHDAQVHDTQLGPGYGHDDLQTANSSNVHMSISDTSVPFSYNHVFTHMTATRTLKATTTSDSSRHTVSRSRMVTISTSLLVHQGGSILESELPIQLSYESSTTGTNIYAHSNYPSTGGSHQGLHTEPLPHTFPDGHHAVAVHHAGPIYNSTASHIMNDPRPPPDAYNSSSVASHGSNDLNLQVPISDTYYFMTSHGGSNFQPPSDPMPEVTKKLGRSIRPSIRKTKRPNRTKFINSKYIPQESSSSMAQAPSSSQLIFILPEFLRNMKEDAQIAMIKALFQQNLFPSTKENSDIATQALDDTVTRYSAMEGVNGNNLVQWKLGPDGKNLLARMKAAVKEIHSDFEQVAVLSWISAYGLSHNISMTKVDMQTARFARLTTLLSNHLFADEVINMAMNNGQIISYRTPFGHPAILDLLEQIICIMQYSCYISLDTDDWEPRLTNAIALAATSCAWSLEKGLAGPWSGGGVEFESDANRTRYNNMKSRLPMLSQDEASRFHELLCDPPPEGWSSTGFGPGLGFWKAQARGSGPGFQIRNAAGKYFFPSTVQLMTTAHPDVLGKNHLQERTALILMPPTVMSDDDVVPITARSRRMIIPSSRLIDSNNSATPELTSHKHIQQTVQPAKTCPKRSAMDADWSLSSSDIEDLDGNSKQTKGKHLWRSGKSSFADDTHSIVSLDPLIEGLNDTSDGLDATDTIDGNITPVDDDDLLQDVNVQDVSEATTVRREDKSHDVGAFFGKSYAHKSKDGKTHNMRDCDLCK
ncbi:hypothetical protein DFH29DRAFT_876653 [Suillus ampliporus]|nr:hypothetical protein DFH29DRAFT_876653 [Suillus ampliporus]